MIGFAPFGFQDFEINRSIQKWSSLEVFLRRRRRSFYFGAEGQWTTPQTLSQSHSEVAIKAGCVWGSFLRVKVLKNSTAAAVGENLRRVLIVKCIINLVLWQNCPNRYRIAHSCLLFHGPELVIEIQINCWSKSIFWYNLIVHPMSKLIVNPSHFLIQVNCQSK